MEDRRAGQKLHHRVVSPPCYALSTVPADSIFHDVTLKMAHLCLIHQSNSKSESLFLVLALPLTNGVI